MKRAGLWALRRKLDGELLGLLPVADEKIALVMIESAGLEVREVQWFHEQWLLEPSRFSLRHEP